MNEAGFDMEKSQLKNGAIFKLIFDAVDNAAGQQEMGLTEEEDGFRLTGENENGEYSLLFDKESKVLKGIEIPGYGISVNIHNFALMQDTSSLPNETAAANATEEVPGEAVNAAEVTGQPAEEVVAPQETVAETTAQIWETTSATSATME